MAGCTFDSQNYVGIYQNGWVVVVNGSYIAAPSGGIIWSDLNAAENEWNSLEGCGGGGGGGSTCSPACVPPQVCLNGVCVSGPPPPTTTCPPGQLAILGHCYPQQEVLIVGAIGLFLLLRRK